MVFHEITKEAIIRALDETRQLDTRLVDAQETRRILDRLYGYEVSPVLWRKVRQGLSAGRVQSVATRIVVERERERMAFRAASYWDVEGDFAPDSVAAQAFSARLSLVDGKRVATGRDFGDDGLLKGNSVIRLDEAMATLIANAVMDNSDVKVTDVAEKPYTRRPYAPFTTSTLQQEASRKLHLSSKNAMRVAQRLYENGYITYMRTDSTTLSEAALTAARGQARDMYGAEYVPGSPRRYEKKVKNAQEAHEAIRPAGDRFRTPAQVAGELRRGAEPVTSRADRLVGLLRVLDLVLVAARGVGDVLRAIHVPGLAAGRGQRGLRQRGRVGAHVRDVAVLVQPLGHPHGVLAREAQLAACFLLQRRGRE